MSQAAKIKLAELAADYTADPLGWAQIAFPWGEVGTPLEGLSGPRKWQADILATIRDHLKDPVTRHQPLRIAVASGHGSGKTGLIAMIANFALSTMPDTRVVCTAMTESQLVGKVMAEIIKWNGLSLTKDWFKPAAMSLASTERGHGHSWRLDAVPWSATATESFAGLHNAGRRIVVIMDEASGIDDKVWSVAEGALTDSDTEVLWLVTSNPTRADGRFRDCFSRQRHLWVTRNIDSRLVEGTNRAYLQELVDTYGESSDLVKVRVKGEFPSGSSLSLIGRDLVDAARSRVLPQTDYLPTEPIIFGLDHARFGSDESILAIRQGRDARSRPWLTWSGADSMQIAGDVNDAMKRYKPDAIFIDAGGPNAGGVIDRLRQLNPDFREIFEVHFGSSSKGLEAVDSAGNRTLVANKRAQMAVRAKSWLERGVIPDDAHLAEELSSEYSYNKDNAILLEKKEHLKARIGRSSDRADALWLTFSEDVAKQTPNYLRPFSYREKESSFDRYAELSDHRDEGARYAFDRYGTAMPSSLWPSNFDRYDD